LRHEAEELRKRFEEQFWVEDQRYYAMALDGEKRPLDAIGSNAGQCLWAGIASAARGRDVADGLMSQSMFSGWGVRTYGAGQPGYNPIGYHTGSVWPHDTSDRGGAEALRLGRGVEPPGRARFPGGPALRRLPVAGAVLWLRPRPFPAAGPVP